LILEYGINNELNNNIRILYATLELTASLFKKEVTLARHSGSCRLSQLLRSGEQKNQVQGQPGQKASKTPSQPISWVWWYTAVIPAPWEAMGKRNHGLRPIPGKNCRPYLKNN
jgi:hypothetical protein